MPTGRSRPLSPHLTIWRWQPPAIVSIIHRITGVGLALVGTPALVWFLCALAAGPQAYASFLAFWSSWFGMVVLIGLTWAVFQHMLSGVRHLFMDIGAGYELATARRSSLLVFAGAIILTVGYWSWLLLR
ncbi:MULTISPECIES: succinate dehydrogenase, cytochrome b556 subunit [unclassified Sphingomonas]|uniref:succinate dehydrogenase, cytochrome b556 subunit n=1 Tax=unclassified Sphingomonas TaxID=196159 RepID=UPI000E7552B6|nr:MULTISPECIES: succinate dehydrogenase, cytochrome b556 subunit [unclassified Sphingomonas]RKE43568.1 succinate dehydrogenase subunit C [Sphingomonas sp. PP-CC-1A-547]TCM05788.1 succinate dehydrogenase subunit C [Sphingomonas sp. PP-CC-3G-468]